MPKILSSPLNQEFVHHNSPTYLNTNGRMQDQTTYYLPTAHANGSSQPPGSPTTPRSASGIRASPLHRGEACLTCRRRKMKCDAGKPSCGPCARQGKADECEYEESRFLAQISRLETEVATLKARIRELEGGAPSTSSATNSPEGATLRPAPHEYNNPSSGYGYQERAQFTAFAPSTTQSRGSPSGSSSGSTMGPPPSVGGVQISRPPSAYGHGYPTTYDRSGVQYEQQQPRQLPGIVTHHEQYARGESSAMMNFGWPWFGAHGVHHGQGVVLHGN